MKMFISSLLLISYADLPGFSEEPVMAVDQSSSVSVMVASASPATGVTPAAESEAYPKVGHYLCKLGREVRTLKVELEGGKCTAFYTKGGKSDEVGQSYDGETCYKVIEKIRSNLEKGEWKCRDVSGSRATVIGD